MNPDEQKSESPNFNAHSRPSSQSLFGGKKPARSKPIPIPKKSEHKERQTSESYPLFSYKDLIQARQRQRTHRELEKFMESRNNDIKTGQAFDCEAPAPHDQDGQSIEPGSEGLMFKMD